MAGRSAGSLGVIRGNVPNIEHDQNEASSRFDEARRTIGALAPQMPAVPESKKANLALWLGVSPLPISAINTAIVFGWPDQQHLGILCVVVSCIAAAGAMIMGSSLGGRRAPILAARLGYLFGLGWLSLWVLGAILLKVADAILSSPVR